MPEPTAAEALAYAASKIAEWTSYGIIAVAIGFFWIGTP